MNILNNFKPSTYLDTLDKLLSKKQLSDYNKSKIEEIKKYVNKIKPYLSNNNYLNIRDDIYTIVEKLNEIEEKQQPDNNNSNNSNISNNNNNNSPQERESKITYQDIKILFHIISILSIITFITLLFTNNLYGTYEKWFLILIASFIGLILIYMFWITIKSYYNFKNIQKNNILSPIKKIFSIFFYFDILNTILLISLFAGLILIIVKYKKIRISSSDGDSDEEEDFQVDCNCNICKEYYAKPYNTY